MRAPLAITSAALLLTITACGPSAEEQAFLDGMGCEDGENAEECGERLADDMMETAPEPQSFSGSDAESGVDDAVQSEYSERFASEPFNYDQHSVYRDPDTGAELGTITINSIDSSHECGIAVGVELNTVGESESVSLEEGTFVFIDDSGKTTEGAANPECDEPATMKARADDITEQVLVFDVDMDTGSVALNTHDSTAFWTF